MSGLVLLLAAAFVVVVVRIVVAWRRGLPGIGPRVFTGGLGIFVLGGIIALLAAGRLSESLEMRNWPSVDGVVTASFVGDGRLYRPEVQYRYRVAGVTYVGHSNLNAPGFGGKTRRREVAVKSIAEYPAGSSVRIHYNPQQPGESRLLVSTPWNVFGQLSLGLLLFMGGALIVLLPREMKNG
ncbi:MAG: DUF3592 domain-containing protein [candidate division Zixibacteria bacterium]|nr:DUF3592 domain-containing protein [candidate division Zixibacteria bacterium]